MKAAIEIGMAVGFSLASALGAAAPARPAAPPPPNFPRVPLREIAAAHGFTETPEKADQVALRSRYLTLVFTANSRRFTFDGLVIYLNGPLLAQGGRWTLAEPDVRDVIEPMFQRDAVLANRGCSIVMLDPGHGGADKGAISRRGVQEKAVVLDIARRVRDKLETCGVTVVMTRDRDRTLSLDDRSRIARERAADVFVSIHINSSRDPAVSGFETFVATALGFPSTSGGEPGKLGSVAHSGNRQDAANTLLGYYLHKGVVAYGGSGDRGLKRARFQVLRDASCPAALVECGFVSNPRDEEMLRHRDGRDAIADGIARGILTYLSAVREAQSAVAARAGAK